MIRFKGIVYGSLFPTDAGFADYFATHAGTVAIIGACSVDGSALPPGWVLITAPHAGQWITSVDEAERALSHRQPAGWG